MPRLIEQWVYVSSGMLGRACPRIRLTWASSLARTSGFLENPQRRTFVLVWTKSRAGLPPAIVAAARLPA
jgi:hypothetical protein